MSTPTKKKAAPREQVTLEFPNNALLAVLEGTHQKNFARLEQKLGVRVAMRGNLVAVEGAAADRGSEPGDVELDSQSKRAQRRPTSSPACTQLRVGRG